MWAAVMGEEFSANPDPDWATSVQQLYAGIEPQAALQVALADGGQGYKALKSERRGTWKAPARQP